MNKLSGLGGSAALCVGHMAGMIDLAALPLWIGALMKHYQMPAERAGLTITAFLGAVMVVSCLLAPRFHRLNHRAVACCGFAAAALAFFVASRLAVRPDAFGLLVAVHAVAGLGAGSGLSVTHGLMGRTASPHRLFGIANMAMGVLAIVLFAVLPGLIAASGGRALFEALALTMAFASVFALLSFPRFDRIEDGLEDGRGRNPEASIPSAVWPIIGVIICMAMNQAMVFAFVERLGVERGFGERGIQLVLIIMGFVNLLPGLLAALLENRLPALTVGAAGALLQAAFAVSLTSSTIFPLYALPLTFYVALVIFTHVFLFGLLSKVDVSGRAVAATPAMMMVGSATGPALGGVIVVQIGYRGLGWAAVLVSVIALTLILLARRSLSRSRKTTALASA